MYIDGGISTPGAKAKGACTSPPVAKGLQIGCCRLRWVAAWASISSRFLWEERQGQYAITVVVC